MKAAEVYAKTMTEAQLSERIRRACLRLKLLHFHPFDSRKSQKGWPDWAILGPHRLILRELKTEKGRLTVDQVLWLDALVAAGYDAEVWRPSQWCNGQIVRDLHALANGGAK